MLALISPTKKLDFTSTTKNLDHSQPEFMDQALILNKCLRRLSFAGLQSLMKLSDGLADVNFDRVKDFAKSQTLDNAKQASLTYSGETFIGLDAENLAPEDFAYAQDHLRILSGLYGVLRPLDLIQPYRLEMACRLSNPVGDDLYKFWGKQIAESVKLDLADHPTPVIINLASQEYTKAAKFNSLEAHIITPAFQDVKDGVPKTIGTFSKRARGMMARYMIVNRIDEPEGLKKFAVDGYKFKASLSDADNWVFTRKA